MIDKTYDLLLEIDSALLDSSLARTAAAVGRLLESAAPNLDQPGWCVVFAAKTKLQFELDVSLYQPLGISCGCESRRGCRHSDIPRDSLGDLLTTDRSASRNNRYVKSPSKVYDHKIRNNVRKGES